MQQLKAQKVAVEGKRFGRVFDAEHRLLPRESVGRRHGDGPWCCSGSLCRRSFAVICRRVTVEMQFEACTGQHHGHAKPAHNATPRSDRRSLVLIMRHAHSPTVSYVTQTEE